MCDKEVYIGKEIGRLWGQILAGHMTRHTNRNLTKLAEFSSAIAVACSLTICHHRLELQTDFKHC